jgi:hypothetical protein
VASADPASTGATEVRASSTIPSIAVIPRNTWSEAEEPPPSGLDPNRVYIFRPDTTGKPVGLEVRGTLRDAHLSPVGDLLALLVTHVHDGTSETTAADFEVVVADTSGDSATAFPGAVRASWRDDGGRLAVAVGSAPWTMDPSFDSVFVWDPRTHGTRGFHVPRCRGALAWDGQEVLLVEPSPAKPPLALTLRTGSVRPIKRRGVDVSPDRSYAIARLPQPTGWGIFDATGADLTTRAVRALHSTGKYKAAHWVAYEGEGHLACISWCDPAMRPQCRTALLDVKRMRLVGRADGRLIGVTSDRARAVVYLERERFLGRKDWEPEPAPPR